MKSPDLMRIGCCVCLCLVLIISQAKAQQPDSLRIQSVDSIAIQQFMAQEGPAEAVFSLTSPRPYKFKSGVYRIGNPNFPLLNSPDSLIRVPIEKAYKQQRRARVSLIAMAVPLAVLTYSITRIALSLPAAIVNAQSTSVYSPSSSVIRVSGIGIMAGVIVTGSFNIASMINLRKGVKGHNALFGRHYPTIFNPKGL